MMTHAEKCAYARGYSRGGRHWPDHRPPEPPNEIVAQMMRALQSLRDAIDDECAKFDEFDPICERMNPLIIEADASMIAVTAWLRAGSLSQVIEKGEE